MGLISSTVGVASKGADYIFNYSKDKYIEKIVALEALIARLENHLAELEQLKGEINSFWNDEQAIKVTRNIDSTISSTKIQTLYAKNMMSTFQKTVEEMDASQAGLDTVLDAAQAILGALGV